MNSVHPMKKCGVFKKCYGKATFSHISGYFSCRVSYRKKGSKPNTRLGNVLSISQYQTQESVLFLSQCFLAAF